MMEDFIRKNFGNDYANYYRESTENQRIQIDLNFISILATGQSKQPVSIDKETIIKDGKLKLRYILEADIDFKRNRK